MKPKYKVNDILRWQWESEVYIVRIVDISSSQYFYQILQSANPADVNGATHNRVFRIIDDNHKVIRLISANEIWKDLNQ